VRVVEGRELDHAGHLARLAVEADAVPLEVGARGLDVDDAEGRRDRALAADLLDLAEPDRQPRYRRLDLGPPVLLELVGLVEAEHVPVPVERFAKVGDVDRADEVAGVLERPRPRLVLGCLTTHWCLPSSGLPVFILRLLSCQACRSSSTTAGRCRR